MKSFFTKYTFPLLGVIGAVAVSAAVFAAWTEPTQTPPGGNLSAPLTVSSVAQFKEGALALGQNTLPTSGSILDVKGTVSSKGLLVNGVVAIIDGSQGNGKVLTSNETGVARWSPNTGATSFSGQCGIIEYPYGGTSGRKTCDSEVNASVTAFNNQFSDANALCSCILTAGSNSYKCTVDLNNSKFYIAQIYTSGTGASSSGGAVNRVKFCHI